MECNRVSKKECKVARQRALKLLNFVQQEISKKYKFSYRLVGSGKWGTMVKDERGQYDLDYQILLTKNSKVSFSNLFFILVHSKISCSSLSFLSFI